MKLYKANKKQASLSLVLCVFGDSSFPLIIIQSCVIICTSLSVCDYVFIDGKLIDKVNDFKYLGTFFGANLKWSSNTGTDHI